jgi:hypothetical protein
MKLDFDCIVYEGLELSHLLLCRLAEPYDPIQGQVKETRGRSARRLVDVPSANGS